MSDLILKLVKGEDVTKEDIENALYDICDSVHSGCNNDCPVYLIRGGIPYTDDLTECRCFKDGEKMKQEILQGI